MTAPQPQPQPPFEPPHVMTEAAWKRLLAGYYRDLARQASGHQSTGDKHAS